MRSYPGEWLAKLGVSHGAAPPAASSSLFYLLSRLVVAGASDEKSVLRDPSFSTLQGPEAAQSQPTRVPHWVWEDEEAGRLQLLRARLRLSGVWNGFLQNVAWFCNSPGNRLLGLHSISHSPQVRCNEILPHVSYGRTSCSVGEDF